MTEPRDELLERYADAVAQDPRRPSDRVRNAARAHAQMLRDQAAETRHVDGDHPPAKVAANQPQWTLSLVASLAVVGLAGLLYVQIDRGDPDVREVALGTPAPNAAPAVAAAPPIAAAPPAPTAATLPVAAAARVPAKPAEVAVARPVAPGKSVSTTPAPVAPPPPVQEAAQGMADAAVARSDAPAAPAAAAESAEANAAARSGKAVGAPRYDARSFASAEPTARSATPAAKAAPAPPPAPAPVMAPPPAAAVVAAAPPPVATTAHQRTRDASSSAATAQFLEAVRSGDTGATQALLAQGVAINTRDGNGNTALMLAVRYRRAAAVRQLLDAGADTRLANKDGLTALNLAHQMGFADIAKLLEAAR